MEARLVNLGLIFCCLCVSVPVTVWNTNTVNPIRNIYHSLYTCETVLLLNKADPWYTTDKYLQPTTSFYTQFLTNKNQTGVTGYCYSSLYKVIYLACVKRKMLTMPEFSHLVIYQGPTVWCSTNEIQSILLNVQYSLHYFGITSYSHSWCDLRGYALYLTTEKLVVFQSTHNRWSP